MNILMVVPYVPNLIRVRPFQLLKALVRRNHQITLATLWTTDEERAQLQTLVDLGVSIVALPLPRIRSIRNMLFALPTRTPLQAVYCWQPALAQRIQQILSQQAVDVVHVEHLRGAGYGLEIQKFRQTGRTAAPVIWDSVDCISYLFQQAAHRSRNLGGRLMTGLDLARTRRYEGKLVGHFPQVVVSSPADKAALELLAQKVDGCPPTNIQVVANGVDLAYFAPGSAPRRPATLVFSGKLSYHANVTAALHLIKDIMPRVWAHRPDVSVWLVGKDPVAAVRRLATDGKGEGPRRQITVTGTVPDIRPYLQQATIAVAPVPYGAGIQNKVLEAMACGAPVVASPQACLALNVEHRRDLLVAPNPEAFAQAILHLLNQPEQRHSLGAAARRYVEQHHSWNTAAAQLERIYQTAICDYMGEKA